MNAQLASETMVQSYRRKVLSTAVLAVIIPIDPGSVLEIVAMEMEALL